MKKLLLLSFFCVLLILIVYSQRKFPEKKVLVEALDEIVIQTGKSSITMKKDGSIIISGSNIQIVGADDITVKSSNQVLLKGNKIKDN